VEKELALVRNNPLVILSPLPRYMEEACCNIEGHMTGRLTDESKKKIEEEVYQARQNLKNFAFRKGLRRSVTISTWGLIKRLSNIWKDAVHLTEAGYFAITEGIVEVVAGIEVKEKRWEDVDKPVPAPKRARTEAVGDAVHGGQRGRGGAFPGQHQRVLPTTWSSEAGPRRTRPSGCGMDPV
jgi:hypothetical protein